MQESCSNEADQTSLLYCKGGGGKLQTSKGNFQHLKFCLKKKMFGRRTSVTFQSSHSAFACSLTKPSLSFLYVII